MSAAWCTGTAHILYCISSEATVTAYANRSAKTNYLSELMDQIAVESLSVFDLSCGIFD